MARIFAGRPTDGEPAMGGMRRPSKQLMTIVSLSKSDDVETIVHPGHESDKAF